jgi:SAM-dependent methyltransferase
VSVARRLDPGLWLLLHLRHPGDRRRDCTGRCAVCGSTTRFVQNRWVLPAELARSWPPGFADRESQLCAVCGSSARVRGLAAVLLELYSEQSGSIAELVEEELFRSLDVAEINSIGRMHAFLEPLERLTFVEYPQEDVQALSFPDASFDLVLTSDTMEHVEDPMRGFRELRRVLRPGGRHVFTVPLSPARAHTTPRAGLPAEHHGRGGGPYALVSRRADMLAHTDFGADLPELLVEAGFETTVHGAGMEVVFSSLAV